VLGIFDGLTALISAPEVAPQIVSIVIGSTLKGIIAGVAIGYISHRVKSLPVGVLSGLAIGAFLAFLVAINPDPQTGRHYYWEIMLPGSLVGVIVGYATQKYGRPRGV
jgi:F0F1-type ATP synthase assembly protein I